MPRSPTRPNKACLVNDLNVSSPGRPQMVGRVSPGGGAKSGEWSLEQPAPEVPLRARVSTNFGPTGANLREEPIRRSGANPIPGSLRDDAPSDLQWKWPSADPRKGLEGMPKQLKEGSERRTAKRDKPVISCVSGCKAGGERVSERRSPSDPLMFVARAVGCVYLGCRTPPRTRRRPSNRPRRDSVRPCGTHRAAPRKDPRWVLRGRNHLVARGRLVHVPSARAPVW